MMTGIFRMAGQSFGFETRDKFEEGKTEYLNLDQVWFLDQHDLNSLILAFEVQNDSNLRLIYEDELKKLADMQAYLKVVCYYPLSVESADKELSKIAGFVAHHWPKLPDAEFLILQLILPNDLQSDGRSATILVRMRKISETGSIAMSEEKVIAYARSPSNP